MALSESTAPNRAGAPESGVKDPSQDVQTLISLLGEMVPLLLRLQAQGIGAGGGMGFGQFPFLQADLMLNPVLDRQAAVGFVENMAADSLQTLSRYVDRSGAQNHELDICKPIVAQANNSLAAHDFAQTLNLIWQAYRLIFALRAANPQLPVLRSEALGKTATADRPSTQH